MLHFHPATQPTFTLPQGEIHIWRAPLEIDEVSRRKLEGLLSKEERQRAGRFVFERDQNRFIACRGRLRTILAGYLGMAPDTISFSYGEFGKPYLKRFEDGLAASTGSLFFNVTHSQDLALVCLCRSGEVGVDVERLRSIAEAQAIARRYFTANEHEALARLQGDELVAAFFRCWTRKEALLKALGVGIGFSLNEVEVNVEANNPPRLRTLNPARTGDLSDWRLYHLEPEAGYVGAVAASGSVERLLGWEWAE